MKEYTITLTEQDIEIVLDGLIYGATKANDYNNRELEDDFRRAWFIIRKQQQKQNETWKEQRK